jgi:hypothetical protein
MLSSWRKWEAMESADCYLGLGLILGALIASVMAYGEFRRRAALNKIRGYERERSKTREMMQKAAENRRKGLGELGGALLLLLLGIALLIYTAHLLSTAPSF